MGLPYCAKLVSLLMDNGILRSCMLAVCSALSRIYKRTRSAFHCSSCSTDRQICVLTVRHLLHKFASHVCSLQVSALMILQCLLVAILQTCATHASKNRLARGPHAFPARHRRKRDCHRFMACKKSSVCLRARCRATLATIEPPLRWDGCWALATAAAPLLLRRNGWIARCPPPVCCCCRRRVCCRGRSRPACVCALRACKRSSVAESPSTRVFFRITPTTSASVPNVQRSTACASASQCATITQWHRSSVSQRAQLSASSARQKLQIRRRLRARTLK